MLFRLKKDILTHLTEVAAEHWRRADAALPTTTKRLLLENYQLNKRVDEMYAEIKLLQQQSVEWRAEDARQVGRMRELQTTNTATTNRNITINMVSTCDQLLSRRSISHPVSRRVCCRFDKVSVWKVRVPACGGKRSLVV